MAKNLVAGMCEENEAEIIIEDEIKGSVQSLTFFDYVFKKTRLTFSWASSILPINNEKWNISAIDFRNFKGFFFSYQLYYSYRLKGILTI